MREHRRNKLDACQGHRASLDVRSPSPLLLQNPNTSLETAQASVILKDHASPGRPCALEWPASSLATHAAYQRPRQAGGRKEAARWRLYTDAVMASATPLSRGHGHLRPYPSKKQYAFVFG